jgi:hypothetical protein
MYARNMVTPVGGVGGAPHDVKWKGDRESPNTRSAGKEERVECRFRGVLRESSLREVRGRQVTIAKRGG